jgi:hypothetical protein
MKAGAGLFNLQDRRCPVQAARHAYRGAIAGFLNYGQKLRKRPVPAIVLAAFEQT